MAQTAHLLAVGDRIKISDGVNEKQAEVSAVTNDTVFEALNLEVGDYGFSGAVSVFKISNSQKKGADYKQGGITREFDLYENSPQIIFDSYEVNESNMVHDGWLK